MASHVSSTVYQGRAEDRREYRTYGSLAWSAVSVALGVVAPRAVRPRRPARARDTGGPVAPGGALPVA
jgi:hypothetical protein